MTIAVVVVTLVAVTALAGGIYIRARLSGPADRRNLQLALDTEVGKYLRQAKIPGMVLGVYKNGATLVKGHGTVSNEIDFLPDASTVFQVGGMTRIFTTTLLQLLCDEGVVSMDATLGKLIGHCVHMSNSVEAVTLRQLVTHTSGFPAMPTSLRLRAAEVAGDTDEPLDPFRYLGPEYVFDYLETAEDKQEAGRFHDSNFGMGLLALVLEHVTGKEYAALLYDKILRPLSMTGTGVVLTPDMRGHLAQGYTAQDVPTPIRTFPASDGAGAINSNAGDMLKFVQALLGGNAAITHAFSRMQEPQPGGESCIGWLQPSVFDKLWGNTTVVRHEGSVGGYSTYLSVDARSGTGIAVLCNKSVDIALLGVLLHRLVRTQSWARAVSKPMAFTKSSDR